MISNQLEYTQMVLMAAPQIGDDMVLKKLPWLTPEDIEEVKKSRQATPQPAKEVSSDED